MYFNLMHPMFSLFYVKRFVTFVSLSISVFSGFV